MKNINLIEARKEKGFTQQELALKLGYKGKQTVANWENGHSSPTLKTALEVSELLERDISFLFGLKVQGTCIKSTA